MRSLILSDCVEVGSDDRSSLARPSFPSPEPPPFIALISTVVTGATAGAAPAPAAAGKAAGGADTWGSLTGAGAALPLAPANAGASPVGGLGGPKLTDKRRAPSTVAKASTGRAPSRRDLSASLRVSPVEESRPVETS